MREVKTMLKMIWKTPNNSPDFFDKIAFGLDWWTNDKIVKSLRARYLFEKFVYQDKKTMQYLLQAKADALKDYYNDMAKTLLDLSGFDVKKFANFKNGKDTSKTTPNLQETFEDNIIISTQNSGNVVKTMVRGKITDTSQNIDFPLQNSEKLTQKVIAERLTDDDSDTTTDGRKVEDTHSGSTTKRNTGTSETETIFDEYFSNTKTLPEIVADVRKQIINLKSKYIEEYTTYFMLGGDDL